MLKHYLSKERLMNKPRVHTACMPTYCMYDVCNVFMLGKMALVIVSC